MKKLLALLLAAMLLLTLTACGGDSADKDKDKGNGTTKTTRHDKDGDNDEDAKTVEPDRSTVAITLPNGTTLSKAQYLAYLYLAYEDVYHENYLYQYDAYGLNPWHQQFPYGDEMERLFLADYISRTAQDNIRRYVVLQQLMTDNGIAWNAAEESAVDAQLGKMKDGDHIVFTYNTGKKLETDTGTTQPGIIRPIFGSGVSLDLPDVCAAHSPKVVFNGAEFTIEENDNIETVSSATLGFGYEEYVAAYKAVHLTERAVFFNLYGEGGNRAVSEETLKAYFDEHYVYFKSIQIPLTDSYGRELNKHAAAYSEIIELMNGYRDICEAEDFDAAYAQYEKDADKIAHIRQDAATATTTGFQGLIGNHAIIVATTPSSSNNSNNNSQVSYMFTPDSATSLVDSAILPDSLLNSILSMEVGNVALVENSNGTPCIYLIQRLDIHADPADYANTKKDILYTLKYQEFDAETITKMGEWEIEFAETVMDQCDPKNFCSSDSADAPTPPPTRSTTALTFFPTTTYPYTTTTTPSDR